MSVYRSDVALAALTDGVRFVVPDVETTPSDSSDHVVSVGVVQVDGRSSTLAEPVEWRCNPGVRIENTRIHGITDADVADAGPFSARLGDLDALLTSGRPAERVVLVAHHAGFDLGVLHLEYRRADRALPDVAVLDTLAVARHFKVGAGGYRLPQLLAHYGFTATNHHNALADAGDTAVLLRQLLNHAARNGHTDLEALLAAAQGDRVRSGDYEARVGVRTARARAGSPFTLIERPADHQATHKKLSRKPTDAQVNEWLAGMRECVTLRCPLLPDKAARLAAAHDAVIAALLADLATHISAGRNVDANATLGALALIAKRHLRAADATAFHDQWAARLGSTTRCVNADTTQFDACPDCRAHRACPADTWPHALAVAVTGAQRNLNPKTARPWLGPCGRLVKHAREGRQAVAAHAAWLVVSLLTDTQPTEAAALTDLADSLGLVEPRLVHRRARTLADAGDLAGAITTATVGLNDRDGSTDLAWAELHAYRDALAARHAAAEHARPVRPHRFGHSAPLTRPHRRRFTV